MANAIRYSTTGDTQSLKKGNFFFGVGDVGKGPSSATTYYNGSTPVASGYTIYSFDASQTSRISYASPTTDSEFISITNAKSGQNFTGVTQCLNWYSTQTNHVAVNKDYEPIVSNGLVLNLDASYTPSYTSSGTTWYDLAYSGNNGTLTNGPTFSSANGGSIVFDGTNDYVIIPSSTTLNITSTITLESWIKSTALANVIHGDGILSKGKSSDGNSGVYETLILQNGSFSNTPLFRLRIGSSTPIYNPNTPLTLNQIYHFVSTYDGSTIRIYINGVQSGSGLSATGNIETNTQDLTIGVRYDRLNDSYFNGNIYLNRIYNRALTATEVLQNYQATFPRFLGKNIVMNGLVNYLDAGYNSSYPGSGTTWYNISGVSGGTGTLTNGPTYSTDGGGSIVFDGVDDYCTVQDSTSLRLTNNMTLSSWFKFNLSASSQQTLILKENYVSPTNNTGYILRADATNKTISFVLLNNSVNSVSASNIQNNAWYNVISTYDGSQIKLYINGVLSGTTNYVGGALTNNSPLYVGQPTAGFRVNGNIANTQIYDRSITQSEVLQNYQAQLPTIVGENFITNGLVLYLDAGYRTSYPTTGTTWTNVSGVSGGTGTLTNGPTYTGTSGGTIVFDGTDDYVTTTNFYLSTSPATITTWFRAGTQTSSAGSILRPIVQQGVFNSSFPAQAQGIEINMIRTGNVDVGKLRFSWGGDVDTNYQYMTTNRYDDNQWHCASIVNNGNTFDVYIDGVYLSTKKTYTSVSTSTPMNFGGDTFVADRKWVGSISIIQIYNRAITQLELLQNFNAQKSRFGL